MRLQVLTEVSTLLTRPRGILVLSSLMYAAAGLHSILLGALGWPSMEVLWAAMLIPTIVLAFYWGARGAAASLFIALVLFAAVERLVHGPNAFAGDRLVFAATVFLAIVVLGVAIAGLTELLRLEYRRRVVAERAAATSELAVALKHEIHNPLAALVAETDLLAEEAGTLPADQRESVASLRALAQRIQSLVNRVAEIEEPRRVEYLKGRWMTDLSDD
jgi:signal transduction histidine kinase